MNHVVNGKLKMASNNCSLDFVFMKRKEKKRKEKRNETFLTPNKSGTMWLQREN